MKSLEVAIFWFRRDLRLDDNAGLYNALNSGLPVLPIFIFDDAILDHLPKNDARVTFIYESLQKIHNQLISKGSTLLIKQGNPFDIWKLLLQEYTVKKVFFNKDYEPYAINRDNEIVDFLLSKGISVYVSKDQVIFEKSEIIKNDGQPYTVFSPYKKKWLSYFNAINFRLIEYNSSLNNYYQFQTGFPFLKEIGFNESSIKVKPYTFHSIDTYQEHRDYPAIDTTSYVSPHLRFGTVSIRKLVKAAANTNITFLSELIWREFFMQILYHFPRVVTENFKSKYNGIQWRNNEEEFKHWCNGTTGYPLVDAGMGQLNRTGYMHNRVRMVTASFLCKHLLIDWRWGEAYFAQKLLDFELSSNNGNWQWVAGTGCDAAPYFRVFNPITQQQKFDKNFKYVRKWVEDFDKLTYPKPIVDHKVARQRALETYKKGINV